MSWYPASWQPGAKGAGEYEPKGVPVALVAGPLDGRAGHVYDAREALWVARLHGHLIVASSPTAPSPFEDATVLGRYVLDIPTRTLLWQGLECHSPRAGYRIRTVFGRLWRYGAMRTDGRAQRWRRIWGFLLPS